MSNFCHSGIGYRNDCGHDFQRQNVAKVGKLGYQEEGADIWLSAASRPTAR
jgi:hypothetical protein